MSRKSVQIHVISIPHKNTTYRIEYFIRPGRQRVILFVHGLGGAKENFWLATQSRWLDEYTLIAFDNPGTGNSSYFEETPLQVDDLVEITSRFIEALNLNDLILVGASMGGLITLHYLRQTDRKVNAYINIEGNLMPEDCMFSSKVVLHEYKHFSQTVFPKSIQEMRQHPSTGYRVIADNLLLNTHVKAYYDYSFQTVSYSATGALLEQFLNLSTHRLFIYGDQNKSLSYLPTLRQSDVMVQEISGSDHFVFYDNPAMMYQGIAGFLCGL
jgi:pimeloyl-ACP methyl ester carboxylesterase